MPQENTTAMILFHFCTVQEAQNEGNIITFKYHLPPNSVKFMQKQLHQREQVTKLITSRISSNYCNPPYSNKTTLQHCMIIKSKRTHNLLD